MEKEPIVTMMISDYGMSPLVSYHELIHYVEVTYNGKKYDYAVLLVLDNEDGAYGGREIWGYPKVLGEFDFDLGKVDKSGFIRARCSRPANTPIVEFLFKPISLLQNREVPRPSNTGLNLRLIPSPVPGAKPSVRQFVELDFRLLEGEIWEGVGSLNFPSKSEFDLLHKSPVVEYLSAHFFHNCSAALDPPINIFDF
jgi:acetoacetate decarboxylase